MKNLKSLLTLTLSLLLAVSIVGCASGKASATDTAKVEEKAKEKAYDPRGVWDYTVQTPDTDSYGIMRITGDNGLYAAVMETDQFGTLNVTGFTVVGNAFSGSIDVMGATAGIEGSFDGDSMSGYVNMGADSFPVQATRKSK
ncbi:hypothetical protein MB14_14450 [Roseivirga ehrenbergii]|uniref:Transferrin-binding protein B C-lobe/N-lobe beta barrel domain-containing protein n=1 Tax=Roseivirga ehrenbergii (strain DSM 102268 / JCM 13514 / KCTC 12282 / NCIMB 14502 / KMM 6017) TaxID=279360 RepID=A0A150XQL1_ROSEK|nr:hypothetical protein [Roseivirga ehrenbergii]KYG80981.1 hypothetical protein MB14_14450 [Roseivirga ehrenbergii]